MSVAVFAPDRSGLLQRSIGIIKWLVECSDGRDEIRANVTFHLITDVHPRVLVDALQFLRSKAADETCNKLRGLDDDDKLRNTSKSFDFYPVNLARNVAREAATTHFVVVADIELFPSANFIPMFLEMIRDDRSATASPNPYVFVFPIFEVANSPEVDFPETKDDLRALYKKGLAVTFHQFVCRLCHEIPEKDAWLFVDTRAPWEDEEKMKVFSVTKRVGDRSWEPIFVGTKDDPVYDERLSWSGGSDKMFQVITSAFI
jgi:N-acetyllactosaminide beta-1,3-N-acetylglucosaminyltransferase